MRQGNSELEAFLEEIAGILRDCQRKRTAEASNRFEQLKFRGVQELGDDATALYFLVKEAISERGGADTAAASLLNELVYGRAA